MENQGKIFSIDELNKSTDLYKQYFDKYLEYCLNQKGEPLYSTISKASGIII